MFLAFFIANFAYLMFAIAVSTFIYKFLKKKEIFGKYKRVLFSMLIAILIFFAPQWDLLIQKAIKTYYENFKMIEEIYAYPEFDENGRIESLGVDVRIYDSIQSDNQINTSEQIENDTLPNSYLEEHKDDYLSTEFIEYYIFGSFKKVKDKENKIILKSDYSSDFGYVRIFVGKTPILYERIINTKYFKARYQILVKVKKHYFHTEKIVEYWDKKKHILMAKGLIIFFPVKNEKEKFRYKYLINHGANGIGISIRRIGNNAKIVEKLFNFGL